MTPHIGFVIGRTALAAAAALVISGAEPSDPARPAGSRLAGDHRPNLILITVDSLRADHLGVYGYDRPTSPGIDAFAREGVVVSDGIAQAPYTKASIATLLTGLFPTAHKTYTTGAPLDVLQKSGSAGSFDTPYTDVLSADLPSLPVALRAEGYHTMALSANPYLIPDFGFANGFLQFNYVKGGSGTYARADEMLALAADAVARAPQPYFLWVHLMDTHNPYDPPEPYRSMIQPLKPPRPIAPSSIPGFLRIGDSDDLNLYVARYDAGLRAADAALSEFFATLRANREWDRTGIVLTADHGEGFMEHGLMSHNNSLYDELLHVPMIVKLPGLRPARIRAQVQLADLFPTLAHAVGARIPKVLHGQDVMPTLKGLSRGEPYAYAELVSARYVLRTLDWKFIGSLQGGRELFDLRKDPGESRNMARVDSARSSRFETMLSRAVAMAVRDGAHTDTRPVVIPPVVLERLHALGYLTK